ncbi:MAG TPA: RNA-binding protein [Gammaproteobacteria bacterium]|nr:RNA-binding protein [Gammaproteobacteria bacterium]
MSTHHDDRDTVAVRLDKWLWAARFFKTRALAAEAVKGGKVHVNGDRVKPARSVRLDDVLEIRRGETLFTVIVRGLSGRRGPAASARRLYEETADSLTRRRIQEEQRRLQATSTPHPARRPDKRDRRRLRAWKARRQEP